MKKSFSKRAGTPGCRLGIEHFKYFLYGKNFTVVTDHQALISAFNATERSKTSQCRLTRWIDWLIPFNFDIKRLAGNKMGLIDYVSWNLVGLAIPLSEYDQEFVVASINLFIANLEMIDNLILKKPANQKRAPCRLIKTRAENERTQTSQSISKVHSKHFTHRISGQISQQNLNHLLTNSSKIQSEQIPVNRKIDFVQLCSTTKHKECAKTK